MIMRSFRGFTLVELALAMAFVGVLSISIVLIISNTVAAYQRGLTLTRVNSVGTDLVNDIRASITSSSARDITYICGAELFKKQNDTLEPLNSEESKECEDDNAYNYMFVQKKTDDGTPIYGAFCTGSYSYMWNSGYFVEGNGKNNGKNLGDEGYEDIEFRYLSEDGKNVLTYNEGEFFKLIKVKDSNRAVCVAMRNDGDNRYNGITNIVDISKIGNGKIESGEPVDLLPLDRGNSLAFYDLFVPKPAASVSDDNLFYSVSFVLGTTTGGADVLASGNSCVAPQDLESGSSNYCAINKFNFAIQVNGGK